MQIVTVQFNYHFGPDYKLMLDVFKYSVEKNMPDVEFVEYKIDAPGKCPGIPYNFIYNDVKLKIWRDHLRTINQDVIFADCDMLCTGDARKAFDHDFDIGYTQRTIINRIPMNGGIVFVRPTEESIQFFEKWYETDHRMIECDRRGNTKLHSTYRAKWAGMNQASFGWMMEHPKEHNAAVKIFMTRKWNAVDCDWVHLDEASEVYFIHYKSRLRKVILQNLKPTVTVAYCKKVWYDYLKEMNHDEPAPESTVKVKMPTLTARNHKGRHKVKGV